MWIIACDINQSMVKLIYIKYKYIHDYACTYCICAYLKKSQHLFAIVHAMSLIIVQFETYLCSSQPFTTNEWIWQWHKYFNIGNDSCTIW